MSSLFALAASPDGSSSLLVNFLPLLLVVAIFYFIILMPMKRKQAKVQDFLGNLKVKDLAIIVVFVAFSAVGIYPLIAQRYGIAQPKVLIDKALKRGLDLQGGVHLVLRVQTDTALQSETDAEVERLRDLLKTRNIPFTSLTATNSTEFKIEGVPSEQDSAFREAAADLETNYARSP